MEKYCKLATGSEKQSFTKKISDRPIFLSFSIKGQAQTETAKVYLIREGMHEGSAVPCSIFKDEELLCKLNNKRYSIHEVAPGTYTFHTRWNGNKPN